MACVFEGKNSERIEGMEKEAEGDCELILCGWW